MCSYANSYSHNLRPFIYSPQSINPKAPSQKKTPCNTSPIRRFSLVCPSFFEASAFYNLRVGPFSGRGGLHAAASLLGGYLSLQTRKRERKTYARSWWTLQRRVQVGKKLRWSALRRQRYLQPYSIAEQKPQLNQEPRNTEPRPFYQSEIYTLQITQ